MYLYMYIFTESEQCMILNGDLERCPFNLHIHVLLTDLLLLG